MERTHLTSGSGKVSLRPLAVTDRTSIAGHLQDAEVVRWTTRIPFPYTPEMAEEFLTRSQAQWDEGSGHAFAVCLGDPGGLVGIAALSSISHVHGCAELGFWLGKSYWRRGYMSEAARLVVRFGFEDLGLYRIYASAFRPNLGGRRVLEKLGFRLEGVMREAVVRFGRRHDFMNYGLLRRESS